MSSELWFHIGREIFMQDFMLTGLPDEPLLETGPQGFNLCNFVKDSSSCRPKAFPEK